MSLPAFSFPSVDNASTASSQRTRASLALESHRAFKKERDDDSFYEGPGLHDPVAAGSTSWVSQAAHYFTLYGSPPDPAQHPWGLQVISPRGAQAGLVGISPIRDSGEVQIRVIEGWHIGFQANRFVYVVGVLLSAYWFVSLSSWLGRLGVVLTTNVALGAAFDQKISWRATLSSAEAADLIRRDAQVFRKFTRFVGIGLPSRWWLLPPGKVPIQQRLRRPGDEIAFFRQRSVGAGVSLMSWMFVNRVGPSGALSAERSARFGISDEARFTAEFSLNGRTTSSVARSDSMFWAGSHEGVGESSKTTWSGEAPCGSEQADALCRLAWGSFLANCASEDLKTRPAAYGFSKRQIRHQVSSVGYGFHFPWSLPWLKGLGVGTVFERGLSANEQEVFGGRKLSDTTLVMRGLDESITGGRRRWSMALTLPQKQAPLGATSVRGRLECKHEIDWLTANNGQAWLDEVNEIFASLHEDQRHREAPSSSILNSSFSRHSAPEKNIYTAFACDLLFTDMTALASNTSGLPGEILHGRVRFSFGELLHGAKRLLQSRSRFRIPVVLRNQIRLVERHFDALSSPETLDAISAWGPRALPYLRDSFREQTRNVEFFLSSESLESAILRAEGFALLQGEEGQKKSGAREGRSAEFELHQTLKFWSSLSGLPPDLTEERRSICDRISLALEAVDDACASSDLPLVASHLC